MLSHSVIQYYLNITSTRDTNVWFSKGFTKYFKCNRCSLAAKGIPRVDQEGAGRKELLVIYRWSITLQLCKESPREVHHESTPRGGVNRYSANLMVNNTEIQQLRKLNMQTVNSNQKVKPDSLWRALALLLYIPQDNDLRCSIAFLIKRVKIDK